MNNDFKYKKTFLAIASLLSLNSAVYAEEEADSSDLKTILVSGEIPKVGDVQKETIPESRATLSKNELEKFAGLESAMSGALSYLPGVHFSGAAGDGITEGAISIRGFSGDQIGFTRDGIPINDPLYLTPHTDFFGDPENYESVSVIYGGAGINAPTLTASGAGVEIRTVAPTAESGLYLKQGFGSNSLHRTFARYNFGEYNGLSAWVSASRTKGDLWTTGGGEVESNRYESNIQYKWGNNNSINAILSVFRMRSNAYFKPTLAESRALPYDAGFQGPINSSYGGSNGVSDVSAASSNNGRLQRADFKIQTYALNGIFNLSDHARLKVDPYFVRVADGTAPVAALGIPEFILNADVNGDGDLLDVKPFALTVYPTQYRVGNTARIDFDLSNTNVLQVGLWLDYTHARDQFGATPIRGDGKVVSIDGSRILRDVNGNELFVKDQRSKITTQKLWVQDSWNFASNWNLKTGLAWQHTKLEGENIAGTLSGNAYTREVDYYRFLPSLSLDFQLDAQNQFYYNTTSNIRTPAVASVYEQDATSKQKAETTLNQEIGWRYSTENLLVKTALFYDQFKNRQVAYEENSAVTRYFNAGKVNTKGLEFSLDGKLPHNFTYRGSYTYIDAEQQSDYSAGGVVANTKGKQVFNTPENLLTAGLGYDDGHFYSNLLARYTGSFYGDLANSEKISGYTVVDLNLGYRFDLKNAFVKSSTLRLNINNLFDKEHLSGVSGGTVSANPADAGLYSAPTYYRLAPRSIFANLTLEF